MMELESDRMTGLVLTEEVVKPELQVVLEEYNMRVANSPPARLSEQMEAALYLNHPYGRPVIGWHQEIEKLNSADALAFYKRFYTPNNAILVVAGDVTADEVKTLAEETYGKVPRIVEIGPRVPPAGAHARGRPHRNARRPARHPAEHAALLSRAIEPPRPRPGKAKRWKCSPISLAAAPNSRLYDSLVVEKGIAVSAGAGYSSTALDPTNFTVYGTPKPGVTLRQIESEIDAALAEVADKGVTAQELERAKGRMIADAVYAQDNQSTLARWYGAALATGSTVDDVKGWPDRIKAVKRRRGARRRPAIVR